MRGFVWGGVIGLAMTVAVGHAVALWNFEWPFHQNKIASQSAMDWTRTIAPVGALAGGVIGAVIQKNVQNRPRISK